MSRYSNGLCCNQDEGASMCNRALKCTSLLCRLSLPHQTPGLFFLAVSGVCIPATVCQPEDNYFNVLYLADIVP